MPKIAFPFAPSVSDALVKKEVPKEVVETSVTTPAPLMVHDPLVTALPYEIHPRVSADHKQPKKKGFPFQIHLPYHAIAKSFANQLDTAFLEKHGVEIERNMSPRWLKSSEEFARVTLKRNSPMDANRVFQFLEQRSDRIYKNWI